MPKGALRGRRRSADRTPITNPADKRKSASTVAAIIVGALAVAGVAFIMVRGLGLNPDLDFGAGAYYYADIPDYQKVLNWDVYTAQLPFWVYLLLFLGWGAFVWWLWKRIEK
ncbi:MAG: hypothetical protein J6W82_10130 [Bacteroidales bacterium]|nr:hypothetical protein [Bacteroidales bacterium]